MSSEWEIDEKLRKHGMVCVECGSHKDYNQFPVAKATKKVVLGKPCLDCCEYPLGPAYLHPSEVKVKIQRICPACQKARSPIKFHKSGLCDVCHKEQKQLIQSFAKTCPVCQIEKDTLEFEKGQDYCKACATFIAVHDCSQCGKGFQRNEMLLDGSICVYCAFARGSEKDLIALRALVREDKASARKLKDFIDSLTTTS